MNTEDKLNKKAIEKGFKDWNAYLDWMIHQMKYNSEQITDRILSAIDENKTWDVVTILK